MPTPPVPVVPSALRPSREAERLTLVLTGDWTAARAAEIEAEVERAAADPDQAGLREVALDASAIGKLDTYGAWLIERVSREQQERGRVVTLVGLPPDYRGLMDEMGRTHRAEPAAAIRPSPIGAAVERVARVTSDLARTLDIFLHMLGAVGVALLRVAVRPMRFRLTSAVHQLDRVGLQAVPIILLITFLIGAIIAQQGFFHFRRFGADDYVVDLVGILILREIGVLIVAIMVAGRSGSSYTAELGSMKMREEVDALRTMGFDPVEVLILPRVMALVVALPILTFLGSMSALYGGGVVAWLYGGMSPAIYIARLQEAISVTHFQVGMIKAPFMALVIGIVSCSQGLQVRGSAESLGLQTTTSVVKSIFLVIVLDGLFAIFFASIGM
jgi:phospholipid/cholesterol/gamma-HCH transport system permease protein